MKARQEVDRLIAALEDGSLPEDEPIFVIRSRDRYSPESVRACAWIARWLGWGTDEQYNESLDVANDMQHYQAERAAGDG